MEYFTRVGDGEFQASEHVTGAWTETEQHVAPMLGLMTHLAEQDFAARRQDRLQIGRLSFDILGTITMDPVQTAVRVVRPGRSIELVEVTVSQHGRDAVSLRAWFMQPGDTGHIEASPFAAIPPREQMEAFDATTLWPGGFIASAEMQRDQVEPGHAATWIRSKCDLIAGEQVSALAYAMSYMDIVNGVTVRAQPEEVMFPNIDLTAHLFRIPEGEWIGYDTRVSFGPGGIGETHSVVHDARGPVGTCAQILTVRPR